MKILVILTRKRQTFKLLFFCVGVLFFSCSFSFRNHGCYTKAGFVFLLLIATGTVQAWDCILQSTLSLCHQNSFPPPFGRAFCKTETCKEIWWVQKGESCWRQSRHAHYHHLCWQFIVDTLPYPPPPSPHTHTQKERAWSQIMIC